MHPLVDLIITCYNSERYIDKTLASVFAQTYKNIHIICVNDGSNDNTLIKLEEFRKMHDNLTIVDRMNGGIEFSLKDGIKNLKGEYVFVLDHDDTIGKDAIEKCVFAFQNDRELDAVRVDLVFTNEKEEVLRTLDDRRKLNGFDALAETLRSWNIHTLCLWRRDIFSQLNDVTTNGQSDFNELGTRYLYSLCRYVGFCDGKYYYFQNQQSIGKKFSIKRFVLHTNYMLQKVFEKNIKITPEIMSLIKKYRFQSMLAMRILYSANRDKLNKRERKDINNQFKFHYKDIDKESLNYLSQTKRKLLLTNFFLFSLTVFVFTKFNKM